MKIWSAAFFFLRCHESCSLYWSSGVLTLSLSDPSLLSFPIALIFPSQQAASLCLQTALRPFPFRGHIIFCAGLTKSTCWLCFLGTNANILLITARSTEGSLLTFLCRLLPPGGHQWQKRARSEQTFTCRSTSGWGAPTREMLHCLWANHEWRKGINELTDPLSITLLRLLLELWAL